MDPFVPIKFPHYRLAPDSLSYPCDLICTPCYHPPCSCRPRNRRPRSTTRSYIILFLFSFLVVGENLLNRMKLILSGLMTLLTLVILLYWW